MLTTKLKWSVAAHQMKCKFSSNRNALAANGAFVCASIASHFQAAHTTNRDYFSLIVLCNATNLVAPK